MASDLLINIGGIYFHPFEPFLWLVGLPLGVVQLWKRGTRIRLRDRTAVMFFILGALVLLAAIAASAWIALEPRLVCKALMKWLDIFGLALLAFWLAESSARQKTLYWVLFGSAAIFVLLPLRNLQQFMTLAYHRSVGVEPLIAYVLLSRWKKSKLTIVLGLSLLFLTVWSLSRTAWLGLLVVGVLRFRELSAPQRRKWIAVSAALSFLVLAFVPGVRSMLLYRLETGLNPSYVSNTQRLILVRTAISGFVDSPLIGVGAENFPYYVQRSDVQESVRARKPQAIQVHNVLLQVSAETGLVGLAGFLLLAYSVIRSLRWPSVDERVRRALIEVGTVLSLALFLGVLANNLRLIVALFLGLSLSLVRKQEQKAEETVP